MNSEERSSLLRHSGPLFSGEIRHLRAVVVSEIPVVSVQIEVILQGPHLFNFMQVWAIFSQIITILLVKTSHGAGNPVFASDYKAKTGFKTGYILDPPPIYFKCCPFCCF